MFFFLKFKAQLRRTRPDIVRQLDESLSRAIASAGGKVTGDRFVISAVFNDESIGFWLDMYILIENLKKNIESTPDFFGYSLVISGGVPGSPEQLCRFLANHNGVFVDDRSAKRLVPYASFERPSDWLKGKKKRKYGCGSYYRIKDLKTFKSTVKNELDLQKEAARVYEAEEGKNVLVLGSEYSQTRGGLRKYCGKLNGAFPELTICFGSMGLGALVDVWSPSIRSLSGGQPSEEIDNLWELLFRERIRDEVSDYIYRCVKRFLILVFEYYIAAAKKKKHTPVLALVNTHLAGNNITQLLHDALAEVNAKNKLVVLGTGEDDIGQEKLKLLETIFDKIIKVEGKKEGSIFYPKLSTDLWEIFYAMSLFGRYFSPELFQRLFEEDEKNPVMISRALSILQSTGIIENAREPRPAGRHFEEHARNLLHERDDRVKALVRGRLLSWAVRRNISPCFRLLVIIAGLDGVKQIDDLLLLKSFLSDIINETVSGIETAMKSGQFEELVSAKASAIRHIFKTSTALHSGDENDIEKAFAENPIDTADCDAFPILKTQILVNSSAYHLGRRDWKAASEKVKEAILLAQNKNSFCLPQAYRVLSLVCLSKQQINETIEYLGFALANAEKTGNYQELAISAYYAAAAHFLYGDVYNSARLARKSVEQSLASGCPDWADRSRFLEGRLEFELGHYRQAMEIFEALRKDPFGNTTDEKDSLLAAWIYRCKIYLENTGTPKPEGCHDADLFELEAVYLSGDYKRAYDLSCSLKNPFSSENFLYTEQADWRSGFIQCEHLYFTHGEIQNRMISLFRSLSLSRLSESGREQALQDIQKILRDEKLCEMDPWDAVYFFAKYLILTRTEAGPVDMSTAVSMAFKRLQRRAGRIEDIETRRQYLNGTRWNKELSLAAKDFRLI
jgi:tetratricopeptide (TPR) repeat protein